MSGRLAPFWHERLTKALDICQLSSSREGEEASRLNFMLRFTSVQVRQKVCRVSFVGTRRAYCPPDFDAID